VRDQFFGDINDYHKYGLLRTLAGDGDLIKVGVCWMLTPHAGTHGQKVGYLSRPQEYEGYDPILFAALKNWVDTQPVRAVSLIEPSNLIPGASYYSDPVPKLGCDRERYFSRMLDELKDSHLIFFDPDNGLEVPSRPYRANPSYKHLYFREVKLAFDRGHSVLCIQLFPRKARDEYIKARAEELHSCLGVRPLCLRTVNVAYFLAMQESCAHDLKARVDSVCREWSGRIWSSAP
jgi:hypothetical protein